MDIQQYQGQMIGTNNGEPVYIKTDATGNLILSSQTTITEQATAADNAVGLPSVVKVIGGYDGTNIQAIKTDAAGELQVDVLTLPSLPAGTSNIGDVDVLTEPATSADNAVGLPTVIKVIGGYDGANVQAIKTDATGELQVDVLTLPALPTGANAIGTVGVTSLPSLPAGTNNIGDVDVLTLPALSTGANDIGQVLNGYQEVTILPSVARTTSGDTNATPTIVGKYKEAIAFIDITAASGTSPTLDVKFQTQDPVSLTWFDLTSLTFTQKTAVATEMKTQSSLLGSKLRCVYTIGGTTPSFTFSVGLVLKS